MQELVVNLHCPSLLDIIGMHDETHHPTLRKDQLSLTFPEVNRVLPEQVEKRVVLDRGDRRKI